MHTPVSPYGHGTSLQDYYGRGQIHLVNADHQLTQSGFPGPVELDRKHCQRWKIENELQCGAYPVKDGPHAGQLCAGHINALNKDQNDSEE